MRFRRIAAVLVTLIATATLLAPASSARMRFANYDVLTNRYDRASWIWFAALCIPEKSLDCVAIGARPRLAFYARYEAKAFLVDGRYSFTVDVPDGLRCPGYNMPTRDTYSWDANTLFGTIDSKFDVGCFNGPSGSQFWTFALQRV